MNAKQKIHQTKLNQWIGLFKEQVDSGLTIKQWCEENNYSIHTYNYWTHIFAALISRHYLCLKIQAFMLDVLVGKLSYSEKTSI